MRDEEIEAYRRGAATGHRPTWTMGAWAAHNGQKAAQFSDPLDILNGRACEANRETPRRVKPRASAGQRRALDVLSLDEAAKPQAVRRRYKALIRKYHPDANGGSRMHEEKLQRAIKAYAYLKASGFC